MDFGDLLLVLAIIPEQKVYDWLNKKYGHSYELGITQIWGFHSTEEISKRVAGKHDNGVTIGVVLPDGTSCRAVQPELWETGLKSHSFIEGVCAMSGQVGMCRQIQLID